MLAHNYRHITCISRPYVGISSTSQSRGRLPVVITDDRYVPLYVPPRHTEPHG